MTAMTIRVQVETDCLTAHISRVFQCDVLSAIPNSNFIDVSALRSSILNPFDSENSMKTLGKRQPLDSNAIWHLFNDVADIDAPKTHPCNHRKTKSHTKKCFKGMMYIRRNNNMIHSYTARQTKKPHQCVRTCDDVEFHST
jgi:hypothetical protein